MPPRRSQTPHELLTALNSGEIKRGEKGDRRVQVGDVELVVYPASGTVRYTAHGVNVEAAMTAAGRVGTIRLSEPDTGNTIYDSALARRHGEYITELIANGHLDLNTNA